MLSNNNPLDSHQSAAIPPSSEENVNIRVGLAQVEQLHKLGALDDAQAAAGRKAGGLDVTVPARLVEQFRQQTAATDEAIEKLARRIQAAGLTAPARLFLAAGRPLSFFGSQMLLLAQPASKLLFKEQDPAGHYYRLLEDRENVDRLLRRLDALEAEKSPARPVGSNKLSNKKDSTRL